MEAAVADRAAAIRDTRFEGRIVFKIEACGGTGMEGGGEAAVRAAGHLERTVHVLTTESISILHR